MHKHFSHRKNAAERKLHKGRSDFSPRQAVVFRNPELPTGGEQLLFVAVAQLLN
jgi:hypothetical protein